MEKRPVGITILAIIEVGTAIQTIMSGIGMILLLEISGYIENGLLGTGGSRETLPGFIIPLILGIVIILCIYHFIVVYGFWKGKKWGWTLGMTTPVVPAIGAIIIYLSVTTEHILEAISYITFPSIILSIIIVVYLTRPHVKAYFGKS